MTTGAKSPGLSWSLPGSRERYLPSQGSSPSNGQYPHPLAEGYRCESQSLMTPESFNVQSIKVQSASKAGRPALGKPVAVRFQAAATANLVDKFVAGFVHNLYDKGEGVRYAVEQTLGYTAPRTIQQLNRTREITGEGNKMAAIEMLVRDLAADFTDTFMPGLLATFGIGALIDSRNKTFVRHNINQSALDLYKGLMHNGQTRDGFIQAIEGRLLNGKTPHAPVELKSLIDQLSKDLKQVSAHKTWLDRIGLGFFSKTMKRDQVIAKAAEKLAVRLGQSHFDVTLKAGSKTLDMTLPELIRDVEILGRKTKVIQPGAWGRRMGDLLAKTQGKGHWKMIANIMALASSLSIPFAVRLMTRHFYGNDAFPGTKEIRDHFKGKAGNTAPGAKENKKFEWFPYLKESWNAGNKLPTYLTAGFFSVLAGAVLRRFHINGANIINLRDWARVYEFGRSFPFTTVTQMELTYGLLCGFRLASSRDEAEWREAAIRDAMLGWPALTYFFPIFNKWASVGLGNLLKGRFANRNLLIKPNGEVRTGSEISAPLFRHVGFKGKDAARAAESADRLHNWSTFLSAGVSWGALALAVPQFSIWLTNKLELQKLQKEQEAAKAIQPKMPLPYPSPSHFPGPVSNPAQAGGFAFRSANYA